MKVLISAYSCEPGKGSERGVGWNIVSEIAKKHEVWVLTRPDESQEAINLELVKNPAPNLHFVYFTLPFWRDSLRWGQSGAMQLHYYLWQIQAYFVARKLHKKIDFDVVHHVTFVRYSSPSFLALLPIPFVWGPVGGGESAPISFWRDFSLSNKIYEFLRIAWRFIGELDPFTKLTAQHSKLSYATTAETALRVMSLGAPEVQRLSESGMSEAELERLSQCPPPSVEPVRFINIARLLHWKGIYLGLRAFAQAQLTDAEYWILGEGPELGHLSKLAQELGISHKVTFWGMLPRDEVLEKLGQCTVLIHPSLHDSGGWVPLEAMAAGRPILCLDIGGPAALVSSNLGIKVTAETPNQTINDLAEAMRKLATNPTLCVNMGREGQAVIKKYYTWEAKGIHFARIYENIVQDN